jgi:hypothetical protein
MYPARLVKDYDSRIFELIQNVGGIKNGFMLEGSL